MPKLSNKLGPSIMRNVWVYQINCVAHVNRNFPDWHGIQHPTISHRNHICVNLSRGDVFTTLLASCFCSPPQTTRDPREDHAFLLLRNCVAGSLAWVAFYKERASLKDKSRWETVQFQLVLSDDDKKEKGKKKFSFSLSFSLSFSFPPFIE